MPSVNNFRRLLAAAAAALLAVPLPAAIPWPWLTRPPAVSACAAGTLPSGGQYAIAAPPGWNARRGDLLVFAPGYRFPDHVSDLPQPDPAWLAPLRGAGFAVATLSYRKAGLAVTQGVQDLEELFDFIANDPLGCGFARPSSTWLVGGSEGALIATLATERQAQRAEPFVDGTLAACGPIGDFRFQLEYIVDFRVVFDALFPGVIPGSAVAIPPEVIAAWATTYEPAVRSLIAQRPQAIEQLLRVTGAPYDAGDPVSIETTVLTLLQYNVRGFNDVVLTLGGQPVDNTQRVYGGSGDPAVDAYVNVQAERIAADPYAASQLDAGYRTSGALDLTPQGGSGIPVLTLHTTRDPLVPYRHEELYTAKVAAGGSAHEHVNVPIDRYGHCTFEPAEVLGALFGLRLLSR
jgi:hypothetical protein